jgi:alkane 1-monooxygenase
MKDLKYLGAYIIPAIMYAALYYQGIYSYLVVVFSFVLIPILETVLPVSRTNVDERKQKKVSRKRIFTTMLLLNVPIVYGLLGYFLFVIVFHGLSTFELTGMILSMGIVLATSGINVAHELGHRLSSIERNFATLLLIPSLYTHFTVEHNLGHHKNVGTPTDPATARRNQSVYSFWFQSVILGWMHGWQIEKKRLRKQHSPFFSLENEMVKSVVFQLLYLVPIYIFLGSFVLLIVVLTAIVSFLLLETINYIEHYGLYRNKIESGRYERTMAEHSWNSNHTMGRILLYELTRHSDHHYFASKKYQVLDHHDDSPQLPMGYPGSMLMALIPPLWYAKVHPLIDERQAVKTS